MFDMWAPAGEGSHVTTPPSAPDPVSGRDLLRANNLPVEGPLPWGRPVPAGTSPGVFIVELPAPQHTVSIDPQAIRDWLGRAPDLKLDGKHPSVAELQSRLASFWLPNQTILYIGSSQKAVGARLNSMYKTPLGERKPLPSGYWLNVLKDLRNARIWWAPAGDPELYEDTLIEQFRKEAGGLPFAVLSAPGGERRDHGITSPFRPEEPAPKPVKVTKVTTLPEAGPDEMEAVSAPITRRPALPPKPVKPKAPARKKAAALPQVGPSAIETPVVRRSSKAAIMAAAEPPVHLTADGMAALQNELDELTTQRRPEVIARIKAARELGDLSENADYEAARKEQSFLEGRVQQLERMIKNAVIIETEGTGSIVGLGSTVIIETSRHGEETFTIVGSAEADVASGKISFTSPIGKALMGRRAGETVRVQVPAGTLDYTLIEVR
jgi:transcription elongation factor GreA